MNSSSSTFVSSRKTGAYDPINQITMWEENFVTNDNLSAPKPLIDEADMKFDDNQSEDASHGILGKSKKYDQEAANKFTEKRQRRLTQNREAARKSRLRKKAYVQQLESCRLKLTQLEQELDHTRKQATKLQGVYVGGGLGSSNLGFVGSVDSGITTFEMEYGHWVEEQNRQILELRSALSAHIGDIEFETLVDDIMNHYFKLFCMKSAAAEADVFYVMSGMWKTRVERLFMWLGGFRPSELVKVLVPMIEPLTEQQRGGVGNLVKSSQQAEDALSQGRDKLQEILAETVAAGQLVEETYIPQMESFVNQADHLRQATLQQMTTVLTTRQSALWLLALGEYFQRLRALSSLWASCAHDS